MWSLEQSARLASEQPKKAAVPEFDVQAAVTFCEAFRLSDPTVGRCQNQVKNDGPYCTVHEDYDPHVNTYRGLAQKSGVSLTNVKRVMEALFDGINVDP